MKKRLLKDLVNLSFFGVFLVSIGFGLLTWWVNDDASGLLFDLVYFGFSCFLLFLAFKLDKHLKHHKTLSLMVALLFRFVFLLGTLMYVRHYSLFWVDEGGAFDFTALFMGLGLVALALVLEPILLWIVDHFSGHGSKRI